MLALAFIAAGCGGAADPTALMNTSAENDAAPATSTTATPIANAEEQPGVNSIQNADAKSGAQVKVSAMTPKKFSDAHCAKPIMVVFYQPDSIVDADLYAQAKAAAKGVNDLVTLAYTPKDVKAYGDLPSKLGLLTTPGVAMVGRDGTIENFWTTYVDSALIHRSLRNAERSKPCKLTAAEVPAAGSALADATTVANGGTVKNTSTATLAGEPPTTPAVDAAAAEIDPSTGQPVVDPAVAADPAAGTLAGAAPAI